MILSRLFLLLLTLCQINLVIAAEDNFVAGSFILTQKALDEAPFRYADFLRKAVDRVEKMDLPHKEDMRGCHFGYRIHSAGRRSSLTIVEDTLSIKLLPNNTVMISAKINAAIHARAWIRTGRKILFWCWRSDICKDDLATFWTTVDLKLSVRVSKMLSVTTRPVFADFQGFSMSGCNPSWVFTFVGWFTDWKGRMHSAMEAALEDMARTFEHQAVVPAEFSPFRGVFIKYAISDVVWSTDHVIFHANATFSAEVNGNNVTFASNALNNDLIPMDEWNVTSSSIMSSHLLQGVRASSVFLSSLMWYATVTNVTKYHAHAEIMDTEVDLHISYTPPEIQVKKDNLLDIYIKEGLLLAECKPKSSNFRNTLFKFEFYDLDGSGSVNLMFSNQGHTGIYVSLDSIDFGRLRTQPFEPKLPLPSTFEQALVRSGMSKLKPVINSYLKSKPLFLPDKVAPFVPNPQLTLKSMGNGTGYAEVLSYCACTNTSTSFAACAVRSRICQGQANEASTTTSTMSTHAGINIQTGKNFSNNEMDLRKFNFSTIFEHSKANLSYNGLHITVFEDDDNCRLENAGSTAKTYWLWRIRQCAPLFLNDVFMNQYYYLDESVLHLLCDDPLCQLCQFQNATTESDSSHCHVTAATGQSYIIGKNDIYSWKASKQSNNPLIANIFYSINDCTIEPKYVKPQLISTHENIGNDNNSTCSEVNYNSFVSLMVSNRMVVEASWECSTNCSECNFQVTNAAIDTCFKHQGEISIIFTEAIHVLTVEFSTKPYEIVVGSCVTLALISIFAALALKKRVVLASILYKSGPILAKLLTDLASWIWHKSGIASINLGCRFMNWPAADKADDLVQNCMLVLNALMALAFALVWDSDDNPLTLIRHRFTLSVHILDTGKLDVFVAKIISWIFALSMMTLSIALATLIAWSVTTSGSRNNWRKVRLLSSLLLVVGIFVIVVTFTFSSELQELVLLMKDQDQGLLVTDNDSLHKLASTAIKIALGGISLNVLSFTVAFLFHGVGCGLYCGMIVFRIVRLKTNSQQIELLGAPLVILTAVQPFICLHPVFMWSLDANDKSAFLLMNLFIWSLPFVTYLFVKTIYFFINRRLDEAEPHNRIMLIEITHLITFLSAFLLATYFIITFEFNLNRSNLQVFFCCTISTVFVSMMSTSYLLFSLANSDNEFPDENPNPVDDIAMDNLANEELENEEIELVEDEAVEHQAAAENDAASAAKQIWNFLMETREYRDPHTFGWRTGFRRLFLLIGTILFTYVAQQSFQSAQSFSSKVEFHKLMHFLDTNLTWPDSKSALDDVFDLYRDFKIFDSYFMINACLLFWVSLAFDFASSCFFVTFGRKLFACSRIASFLGSLAVFTGIIAIGLPDYLKATRLETILPFCGDSFNAAVKQVGELTIGLFLACLITYQLLPILAMIVPALVRASVAILVHPALLQVDVEDMGNKLRRTVLKLVVMISSFMTVPITFVGMAIVQQVQNDPFAKMIIVSFWIVPSLVLLAGLYCDGRYKGNRVLRVAYHVYYISCVSAIAAFLLYSFSLDKLMNFVSDFILEPTFCVEFIAKFFLSNVVISDMLYMTVF